MFLKLYIIEQRNILEETQIKNNFKATCDQKDSILVPSTLEADTLPLNHSGYGGGNKFFQNIGNMHNFSNFL